MISSTNNTTPTRQVRETVSPQNPISQPAINTNTASENTTNSTQPQSQDEYNSSIPKQDPNTETPPPVDDRINFGASIAAIAGAFLAVLSGTNVDLTPAQNQLNKDGEIINRKGIKAYESSEVNPKLNNSSQESERFRKMSEDTNK